MSDIRLQSALDAGVFTLPSGRVAVFRPDAGLDLGPLGDPADIDVIQPFAPDAAYFTDAGYTVVQAPAAVYDVAVVYLPRAKALALDLLGRACRVAPFVVVDGAKSNGVDSVFKDLKARVAAQDGAEISTAYSKAHGKIFTLTGADFSAFVAETPNNIGDFITLPGVFSADAVDAGSAALAAALPTKLGARVVDLGAGWGYLSRAILARDGVKTLDLVEAEALALDCARQNITDDRATFHWADATIWGAAKSCDTVVMNPPFHTNRAADPALGRAFIATAARILTQGGQLYMVANRHLPYENALSEHFAEHREIAGTSAFKVFHASRPKSANRARS